MIEYIKRVFGVSNKLSLVEQREADVANEVKELNESFYRYAWLDTGGMKPKKALIYNKNERRVVAVQIEGPLGCGKNLQFAYDADLNHCSLVIQGRKAMLIVSLGYSAEHTDEFGINVSERYIKKGSVITITGFDDV